MLYPEKGRVWPAGDSLARKGRSTYVGSADGQNSRLCRVQPPGAAQEPPKQENSASFRPLRSQRSARLTGGAVSSPSGSAPRSTACSRDGSRSDLTKYRAFLGLILA